MKRKSPAPKTPALRRLPPVRRNGTLLLDHLAEHLSLSRRAAKALLDDRLVFVNGRRIWMARHLLQIRDTVELLPDAVRPESRAAAPPVRILLDDPLFLVADKPPRLLAVGDKSLETRLRDQLGLPTLRAVHRLDKDTSGCLLFAKTDDARRALVAQFEKGQIRKIYHALVAGNLPAREMDIRERVDNLPAVSHVRQVSAQTRPPRCAHVTVSIETGRTHQIRIHLQHIGDPVLGDRRYFTPLSAGFSEVPRQMLHASDLRFLHPASGKTVSASSPLPRDFRDWLRTLRLT
ncbi:MAG TPA: RluA family pseudouridine synthase [Kiritimatiellia bacterium]|nr:RluA family pseudouridine synthase [Kiritimatiellia bacterium]HRX07003.1 RluA family pseudouridine synthase [Kiritimatiellia bacterium]